MLACYGWCRYLSLLEEVRENLDSMNMPEGVRDRVFEYVEYQVRHSSNTRHLPWPAMALALSLCCWWWCSGA